MPDFSLVPVDHQPDFEDVSLVPVDYDPFGGEDVTQQAQTPQVQNQPAANGPDLPQTSAPAVNTPTAATGDPGQPNGPPAAPISSPDTPAPANQQQPSDVPAPGPASGGDSSSFGKRFLQGFVDAVPGAYYARLAQEQFRQGNYGAAAIYETLAFGDAALGAATLGASSRLGTGLRAAETLVPAAEEAGTGLTRAAENAPSTFYRGDQAGLTEFRSRAAQAGGQANSEAILAKGDKHDLMADHALDKRNPPSPFISVTTDPEVARSYGSTVYRLQLAPGRAIPNPLSPYGESEYLVPHYISPDEIKGTLP